MYQLLTSQSLFLEYFNLFFKCEFSYLFTQWPNIFWKSKVLNHFYLQMQKSIFLYHSQVGMNICNNYFSSINLYQEIFAQFLRSVMISYYSSYLSFFYYNNKSVLHAKQKILVWIYANYLSLIFYKASLFFRRIDSSAKPHQYQLSVSKLALIHWTE